MVVKKKCCVVNRFSSVVLVQSLITKTTNEIQYIFVEDMLLDRVVCWSDYPGSAVEHLFWGEGILARSGLNGF